MLFELLAFAAVPLGAMVVAVGYTLVATYRMRDWRPPLFVFFLVPMSVHQLNEVTTILATGSAEIVSGFGEYPETVANLTASLSVVLVLRLVAQERALSDRLTARIERERELRRENERLDQFASIVSHDLRNPLNVARGRLDMARDDESDSDENLAAVADALERMETILEETLDMARQGQTVTEEEPVPLGDVARDCWRMVATDEADIAVEDDVAVLADRDRLAQLLENLFRNAVDHAGPDPTVRVGALPDGFYVADDGPGIPADEREAVFEAGHTTAPDGAGFGLAIVRSIAQAHGWSVRVRDGARTDGGDGDPSAGETGSAAGARFEFTDAETRSA